jgi:lipid-binding SYLF domain-containing protein
MKSFLWFQCMLACLIVAEPALSAGDDPKLSEEARAAIEAFKRADSSMAERFREAAGYAIFPVVGKGGLVLGAARGEGEVYQNGVLIGEATLTQVTFGLQVGGQSFSELIFFENQAALDRFKESKLEMSAQVGAVAAAEGASKNARYVDGVLIFTRPRSGLMAEASVGGQKFRFKPLKPARETH